MAFFKIDSEDYFRLFIKRESSVVFGHKKSNMLLLTLVLFVTFIAIAFSNASLFYLSDKMNDPFTNWVNIEADEEGNFNQLAKDLVMPENMEKFHYNSISLNKKTVKYFPNIETFHVYKEEDEYLEGGRISRYVNWNASYFKWKGIKQGNIKGN